MTTKTQDRLKKNPHRDAAHLPALDMGIRDIPLSRAFANVKPDPARRCLLNILINTSGFSSKKRPPHEAVYLTGQPVSA